jgi:hypothetical protein
MNVGGPVLVAPVSLGQDQTVQLEKLSGCEKVFKEKRSGVDL